MGVPGRGSRGLTRPGLIRPGLAVLAVAGCAVLVGACGSQAATTSSATQPASTASPADAASPGSAGTTGGVALCSDQAAVTRLLVSRVSALPQNHLRFAFPAAVTVASPGRARAVAAAVCGLPPMPRDVMYCPADLGVRYRLSFAAGSATFPAVTASAGGCSIVAGPAMSARPAALPDSGPSWPAPWASAAPWRCGAPAWSCCRARARCGPAPARLGRRPPGSQRHPR